MAALWSSGGPYRAASRRRSSRSLVPVPSTTKGYLGDSRAASDWRGAGNVAIQGPDVRSSRVTVAATPPPRAPANSAPRKNAPAKPSTHPAANKPTAQSSMLLTFGTAGLPTVLLGLGRGLWRSRRKAAFRK